MSGINALSRHFGSIVDCITTQAKIVNPFTNKELTTIAIWDTGAQNSVITKAAASTLGLVKSGKRKIRGVHGVKEVDAYIARITLHNENISVVAEVTECDELSADGGINMLIGMNIIQQGDFVITNHSGETVMAFRKPSLETVDFVAELKELDKYEKMHRLNLGKRLPDKCGCGSGKLYKNCHGKKREDLGL